MTSSSAANPANNAAVETGGQPQRPQRADARKNRERVLAAADTVFAAQGMTASTAEIARAAAVGIGTVFRHFPTKEALLKAVLISRLERFAAEARKAAAEEDAGDAFFNLITRAVDHSAEKCDAASVLAESGIDVSADTLPIFTEIRGILTDLLRRAQADGAVRSDVGVDEVIALLIGAARAAEFAGERAAVNQAVRIICDGLRPPGAR